MGLETATFISGLTPSWPTSSELKSQGDDHLRLIKQTLQNTFPAAAKPFYFPKVTSSTATVNLVAADQNTVVCSRHDRWRRHGQSTEHAWSGGQRMVV
jgi:hypothetical protein